MSGPDREAFESAALERVADLGEDIDVDTFVAAFNLFRVSTRLMHDLETTVHRPRGLSMAGFRVLFTVWIFGTLEPRQIARLSGVTRAAVSGVLNTLERDGLATREREQQDGRLVTVRLTAEGERRLREAYQAQNQREQELFADLSTADLQQFGATMGRLIASRVEPPAEDDGPSADARSLRP